MTYHVLWLGDSKVGKSQALKSKLLVTADYSEEPYEYEYTLTEEYEHEFTLKEKKHEVIHHEFGGEVIKLDELEYFNEELGDIGGIEKMDVVVFMFDIDNAESYINIKALYQRSCFASAEGFKSIIVGNSLSGLPKEKLVHSQDPEDFANSLPHAYYLEMCAQNGTNVDELFCQIRHLLVTGVPKCPTAHVPSFLPIDLKPLEMLEFFPNSSCKLSSVPLLKKDTLQPSPLSVVDLDPLYRKGDDYLSTVLWIGMCQVGKTQLLSLFDDTSTSVEGGNDSFDYTYTIKQSLLDSTNKCLHTEVGGNIIDNDDYKVELSVEIQQADLFVFVFDVDNAQSLSKITEWRRGIFAGIADANCILVGNSTSGDPTKQVVSAEDIQQFALSSPSVGYQYVVARKGKVGNLKDIIVEKLPQLLPSLLLPIPCLPRKKAKYFEGKEYLYTAVWVGSAGCGKTETVSCRLHSLCRSSGNYRYNYTIEAGAVDPTNDILHKEFGGNIICDDDFQEDIDIAVKQANVIILMCNVNDEGSFTDVKKLYESKFRQFGKCVVVVANCSPSSASNQRVIDQATGKEFATLIQSSYFEIHSANGTNVDELFEGISQACFYPMASSPISFKVGPGVKELIQVFEEM